MPLLYLLDLMSWPGERGNALAIYLKKIDIISYENECF